MFKIKIVDGNERAVYLVVMHLLKELDILSQSEVSKLSHWYRTVLKNNLDEPIGKILPCFSIINPMNKSQLLGERLCFPGIIES